MHNQFEVLSQICCSCNLFKCKCTQLLNNQCCNEADSKFNINTKKHKICPKLICNSTSINYDDKDSCSNISKLNKSVVISKSICDDTTTPSHSITLSCNLNESEKDITNSCDDLKSTDCSNKSINYKIQMTNKGFNVFSLNIQHLIPKLDQIKLLMYDNNNFDVFSFCETFLTSNSNDNDIHIPGYNMERRDRVNKAGGGIVVYIKQSVPYLRKTSFECDDLEIIFIDICYSNTSPFYMFYL